jgi:SAM-dependent methyltransferase
MDHDLKRISDTTISYYRSHADEFWNGTRDHDVTQNIDALLSALQRKAPGPYDILDLGCGPGRDIQSFKSLDHHPVGLDACPEFCAIARNQTDCPVLLMDFLDLSLKAQSFDGIFANASLFHVPASELQRVLKDLHAALRDGGILFSSNPRGNGEGFNGERYGCYMEFDDYEKYLNQAGFSVLTHYYRPEHRPRSEQPWLAVVAEKDQM